MVHVAEQQERVRAILDALSKEAGVVGATLVTRDGITVVNANPRILTPETFSAMVATLMGAAETAFFQLGGERVQQVASETDATLMVASGVNDELLLVVLVDPKKIPRERALGRIAEALTSLKKLLGGG